ncbi:hypothetical protein Syun_001954 [Stephania yunnanensis]|uniref:Uncharacterized protein n=1 Tax=Stephania yunnanensis TaxID=152371 RepID=A0AAP0LIV7_9MAGN
MEDEEWNWDDMKKMNPTLKESNLKFTAEQNIEDWKNEMVDDILVRGMRLLYDVYQKCNIAF